MTRLLEWYLLGFESVLLLGFDREFPLASCLHLLLRVQINSCVFCLSVKN